MTCDVIVIPRERFLDKHTFAFDDILVTVRLSFNQLIESKLNWVSTN